MDSISMNLESMKKIADKYRLDLYEHENGAFMLMFPDINGIYPMLLSADDGVTWSPDARCAEHAKMWSGNICLRGELLIAEITAMFEFLKLGSPEFVVSVANDLMKMDEEKMFS